MTEPVVVAGQDEPVVFSFFTDVSSHPTVLELASGVQETIRGGIGALVKHANWWKKYRALWKMQRVSCINSNLLLVVYIHVHNHCDFNYTNLHAWSNTKGV